MTELIIDQALQQGIEAHKAGQVQKANRLYTAILKAQPKHPDANHNMGVLAVGVGKLEQALPFFKTALEARPATAQFWLSYIDVLVRLERLADAIALFDQAKGKGAKGDDFDLLEKRLNDANRGQTLDTPPSKAQDTNKNRILDTAIQLRETGKLNQAINLLKEELKRFHEDADMLALLSHCYLLVDQVEEAKLYLNKAKEIAPDNASVGWNTARLNLKEQKPLEALKFANDTSQRFPDDVEGMAVLGACLSANGKTKKGLDVLNVAIMRRPNYAEALINRALVKISQKNRTSAASDLRLAHTLKPHIKNIWDLVVGLTIEAQEYSAAVHLLINMLEIDPSYEKGLHLLAVCNQKADDNELAVQCYQKISELQPTNALIHMNLGIARKKQGNLKAAITQFRKALTLQPENVEAHNQLGKALQDSGQIQDAITAYRTALTIKVDYAEPYYNLGTLFRKQSQLEKAISYYKKALQYRPDYCNVQIGLGLALHENGNLDEAMKYYKEALTADPNNTIIHSNMGNLYKAQGNLTKAAESYQIALATDPNNAEAYNNLGVIFRERGERENALRSYVEALKIKPYDSEILYNYGLVLKDEGKLSEAIEAFSKSGSKGSSIALLKCLYEQNKSTEFSNQLDFLLEQGYNNAVIGSYISRAQIKFGQKRSNPFCSEPLEYVSHTNLMTRYNFQEIFIKTANEILSANLVDNRSQNLITNGIQTTGNIFDQLTAGTLEIQNVLRTEINNYIMQYKDSPEGLIKRWPKDYYIDGWLVSMSNGGRIAPHIHDNGWVSGSVYINVPPKLEENAGNLVVCLNDIENSQSINVMTGSLCLFPSSLLHYTIPFVGEQNRIVMAFDVIPK